MSALNYMYDASPWFVQGIFLNMYALKVHRERYGKQYRQVMSELSKTESYDREQIDQYQGERLKKLVHHAYENVTYYREAFDRVGIKPHDIRTTSDLRHLPVLTRDDVRNNLDRLISKTHGKKRLVHGHTSGTTGSPLEVYWDINTCVYNNAVDWRQKMWGGIRYGDRIALLLGRAIIPIKRKAPPFWHMDYIHNQLWMSAFHMNEDKLKHYVQKLREFRPVAIEGYPSTVYVLARYLVSQGTVFPLRAVFTSSETFYPVQRETIEKAFGCYVFDFYGLAERVTFATECEAHSGRHLNFEFGLTEILDSENKPVTDGQKGFIVSTSLQNFGMPLIRYKTSDVSYVMNETCGCGRQMPRIADVTTKAEDFIVKPDGTIISPSVLTHPFKPMHNIEKSQIIQDGSDHITIKIVRRPAYTEADSKQLLSNFQSRVGPDMEVDLSFVEEIPRTRGGKYRWVISEVPLGF